MRRSPFSLPREERLRGRGDLRKVFREAAGAQTKGLKVLYLRNGLAQRCRVALCPVRGFTGAVQRNRARRLARESFRMLKAHLKPGYDLAFILYPGAYDLAERSRQMRTVLRRAGLIEAG